MSYQFLPNEIDQLLGVIDIVESQNLKWAIVYEKVSEILEKAKIEDRVDSADMDETKKALLWFDGAILVNRGETVFSTLIREYTSRQLELHYGAGEAADVVDQMQEVSDAIARQVVVEDIIQGGWHSSIYDAAGV